MSEKTQTIVIIGSGHAGLSCAEEIRRLETEEKLPKSEIKIFSYEAFCSRPNLFFRFKFPTKPNEEIDYGLKGKDYFEKFDFNLIEEKVVDVNFEKQEITTEKNTIQKYDKLLFATGGIPNYVSFPEEEIKDVQEVHLLENKQKMQFFEKYKYAPTFHFENMYVLRNVEEIQILYETITSFVKQERPIEPIDSSKWDRRTHVFVIGSGALSLDATSSIVDGFQTYIKTNEVPTEKIPKITILSRRNVVGYPLLDEDASSLMTKRIEKNFGNFVSLILEDEVEKILYSNIKGKKIVCGVITKKGIRVQTSCIIQAVGAKCNTELAQHVGMEIGKNGGIVVDDRFTCSKEGKKLENVFAAGDVAEMSHLNNQIWKNWTSSREQAIQCARCILKKEYKSEILHFNQTIRLFGLYIASLGDYHAKREDIITKVRNEENEDRYVKLVFSKIGDDKCKLIGGLIVGPAIADYRLGTEVLKRIKMGAILDVKLCDEMIKKEYEWVAKKRIKNPLLNKKRPGKVVPKKVVKKENK